MGALMPRWPHLRRHVLRLNRRFALAIHVALLQHMCNRVVCHVNRAVRKRLDKVHRVPGQPAKKPALWGCWALQGRVGTEQQLLMLAVHGCRIWLLLTVCQGQKSASRPTG
jgi:hypothetical protein